MDRPIDIFYENIQNAQRIMNWVIVSVLAFYNLLVLLLLRFKIDFWGFFTLLLHFTVSWLRLLTPSFFEQYNATTIEKYYIFSFVATILVWVSLYYFTFEILLVKTALQN